MPNGLEESILAEPKADQIVEQLTFGWWNTSLSPTGKKRADAEHQQIASSVVKMLIDDFKVDCLGLGEVTSDDLEFLRASCGSKSISTFDGTLKEGRLQFDTGMLYNRDRLTVVDFKSMTSGNGIRRFKVANRVDLVCASDSSAIHVFIAHWPRRGVPAENDLIRKTIAQLLKAENHAIEKSLPDAAFIVLGDFNDEPFDESIAWHLLATRDRNLAKTEKGYLYNPFWRQLGESASYSIANQKHGVAGTCFYKGQTDTRWRTFDQILFSPAFLGNGRWHLNENETTILELVDLVQLVQNDKVDFDHLPVLSVIERVSESS